MTSNSKSVEKLAMLIEIGWVDEATGISLR